MKKTTVILVAAVIAGVTVFESCKKYEEGPSLSLRSRKERVANTWKAEKVMEGGVEQAVPEGTVTFDKEGTASMSYTSGGLTFSFTGSWQLVSDDEGLEVTLTGGGFSSTTTATILKLKENELWVKDLGNDANSPDDDVETHYVPAE